MQKLSIKERVALVCYNHRDWISLEQIAESANINYRQAWESVSRILNDDDYEADVKQMPRSSSEGPRWVNHYAVFKVPAFLKVNEKEAIQQVALANELISEHGTMFPDDTFEDGVIAALTWVFGDSAEPLSHDLGGE